MIRKLDHRDSARQGTAWVFLCLFGLLCAAGAPAQQIATVSAGTDAHGTLYLPMRVNETIPARFFFDTGSLTYISSAFVAQHSLPSHDLIGEDGKPVLLSDGKPVPVVHLNFAVGDTGIRFSEDVPVIPAAIIKTMGVACDGILGVNSLSGMAVHLSIVDRRITFLPGGNLGAEDLRRLGMDAANPAPLVPADAGRCQVATTFGDLPSVPMLVDTGSEFTKVPPAFARKIGGEWRAGGVIDTASGRSRVYSSRLSKVSVNGVEAAGQRVLYTDQNAITLVSPLGRDFLGRFAVTLDFPAKKLYLRDLELGPGPSPYARRLRGDETLLPAYTVDFPYGGKTIRGADIKRYGPGSSLSIPGREGVDQVRVVRNSPTVGESRTPVEIPMTIESGTIVVQATIDRQPVRLALDTGSVSTWISPATASRLQLKETPLEAVDVTVKGVTLKAVALSREMPEFIAAECEGFVGEKPGLYSLTGSAPRGVDGVLGLDCLAGLAIGLDLSNGRLLLWPMASRPEERLKWAAGEQSPASAATTLPLQHEAGDWYYVEARLEDGQTARLALATGYAGGMRLPATFVADKVDLVARRDAGDRTVPGAIRAVAPRKSISLAGVALPALTTEVVAERGVSCIPVLGLEALRGRRVVLDFAGKRLLIGPPNVARQ